MGGSPPSGDPQPHISLVGQADIELRRFRDDGRVGGDMTNDRLGSETAILLVRDPHDDRNQKFLTVDPRGGALCLTCHEPEGWSFSSHAASFGLSLQIASVIRMCFGVDERMSSPLIT